MGQSIIAICCLIIVTTSASVNNETDNGQLFSKDNQDTFTTPKIIWENYKAAKVGVDLGKYSFTLYTVYICDYVSVCVYVLVCA